MSFRSTVAVIGTGMLVLTASCGRDVLSASHGLHGDAIRTTSYHVAALALEPAAEPAATPAEVVDVTRAVRDVERIPGELSRLRRLLMYGALGVLICAGLNAVLLAAILGALLRLPARQTAALPNAEPLTVPARRCRCGNAVSEHSRTGRCRRCALAKNRRLAAAQTALQPQTALHSLPASYRAV